MIYIYNVLSIALLGIALKSRLEREKQKKIFIFISFFQMFLIQALRDVSVGTDTNMYVDVYKYYKTSEIYSFKLTHFEWLFKILYEVLQYFTANAQVLLAVISFITMLCFGIYIYNNSSNVLFSTIIFACLLYPNSFNIMRQYMGVSIALNSHQYIKRNQYVRASILIIIGSLIHTLAILVFISMLIHMVKNWKLVRRTIIAASVIFFVFGDKLVSIILSLMGRSFYLSGFEANRYFRLTTFITFLIAVLMYHFIKKNDDKENIHELSWLASISYLNFDFGIMYLKYEFFSRIIELLNSYLIIGLPLGLKHDKSKYRSIIRVSVYLILFLLMLNQIYNSGSGISEYKFFF